MNVTEEVKLRVKEIISDKLGFDLEEIENDTDLRNELGMDSLDAVELVMELEKEFDIRIDDDQAYNCNIVSEIYTLLANS